MIYGRSERAPWRDTMQVCLKGHVINAGVHAYPQYNKDYCNTCGEKTITSCPNCNNPIPGDMQDTGVAVIGFRHNAPAFCEKCGNSFPWNIAEKEQEIASKQNEPIVIIQKLLSRFHFVVRQIRRRYNNRATIDVSDEYDVQDLLRSLLTIFFDDVRVEEWTPSYAGKSARMDFLLNEENLVIEVKMTRNGLGDKEIGDQLLIDIERYKEHPKCKTLVCFIYDPDGRIVNAKGLITDLHKQSKEKMNVVIMINPE